MYTWCPENHKINRGWREERRKNQSKTLLWYTNKEPDSSRSPETHQRHHEVQVDPHWRYGGHPDKIEDGSANPQEDWMLENPWGFEEENLMWGHNIHPRSLEDNQGLKVNYLSPQEDNKTGYLKHPWKIRREGELDMTTHILANYWTTKACRLLDHHSLQTSRHRKVRRYQRH